MKKGYFYAIITAILWSFSGLSTRFVTVNSFVFSGMTALVAYVLTIIILKKRTRFTMFTFMVGICQFLMMITFVFANRLTTIGNTIVLQYSSIVFVLIFEAIDTRKRPKNYQLIVIVLAFIGMIIFFFDSFDFSSVLGNLLAIVSGLFFGFQFYLNTKEQADPETSLNIQYLLSIICMIVYFMISKTVDISLHDVSVLCIAGFGITFFSGFAFVSCIQLIPAFTANVICMSEIFLAPLWAMILLGEVVSKTSFIGASLMIFALFFNVYKEMKESM